MDKIHKKQRKKCEFAEKRMPSVVIGNAIGLPFIAITGRGGAVLGGDYVFQDGADYVFQDGTDFIFN